MLIIAGHRTLRLFGGGLINAAMHTNSLILDPRYIYVYNMYILPLSLSVTAPLHVVLLRSCS